MWIERVSWWRDLDFCYQTVIVIHGPSKGLVSTGKGAIVTTSNPGDMSGRASDLAEPSADTHTSKGTLTFLPLLALVVGSMIGGGIFNLSRDVAEKTAPGPAMIG